MTAFGIRGGRGAVMLAGLAVLLAGIVGLELRPASREDETVRATQAAAAAPLPAAAGATPRRDAWVATILARPLFAPGRRPPQAAASAGATPASLPRVAGILMDGGQRTVIFAATGSGRPLTATEGMEVNGFRVQSIEAGQVTVTGPDGPLVLRPTFDPNPPAPHAAAPSAPGLPGLPGLQNMTGIPGLTIPPAPAR